MQKGRGQNLPAFSAWSMREVAMEVGCVLDAQRQFLEGCLRNHYCLYIVSLVMKRQPKNYSSYMLALLEPSGCLHLAIRSGETVNLCF